MALRKAVLVAPELASQIQPALPYSKHRAQERELDLWLRHPPYFCGTDFSL